MPKLRTSNGNSSFTFVDDTATAAAAATMLDCVGSDGGGGHTPASVISAISYGHPPALPVGHSGSNGLQLHAPNGSALGMRVYSWASLDRMNLPVTASSSAVKSSSSFSGLAAKSASSPTANPVGNSINEHHRRHTCATLNTTSDGLADGGGNSGIRKRIIETDIQGGLDKAIELLLRD
jgi:hypothetical protein